MSSARCPPIVRPTCSRRSARTCACARRAARASCSSRSSRAGSAATRSSAPARGSSRFEEAEALGLPVVGYLAYDHVAKLEPTVPLPADGPDLPESRFVVADTLVRFDHGSGIAEVLAGDADEIARRSTATLVLRATQVAARGRARRSAASPDRATSTRRACGACKEHIRAGDAFQVVLSQRAERPTSATRARRSTARSAASTRRRTSSCSSSTTSRSIGSSPETLVKCEDGRAQPQPDRRDDPARRGRRRAAARLREGPRRARDARRPRPQRPLARLPRRHACTSRASSSRSASRTSRTSSPRSPASCATA